MRQRKIIEAALGVRGHFQTQPGAEQDVCGYEQQGERHMHPAFAKPLGYASHLAAVFDALLVNSVIVQYKGQGSKEQQRHLKY